MFNIIMHLTALPQQNCKIKKPLLTVVAKDRIINCFIFQSIELLSRHLTKEL